MEISIEIDQIDTVSAELEVIGNAIGFDFSAALLTDMSELSDFSFSGDLYPGTPKGLSYNQSCQYWDDWVLNKLAGIGLELKSTKISLLVLAQMISAKKMIH